LIRRLGWLPDEPKTTGQKSDRAFGELAVAATPVPDSSDNGHLIVDVLDQGRLGTCVAHAVVQALRAAQVRAGGIGAPKPPLASRLFAYYFSRAYHGATLIDGGTFLRTCFAALNKFGFPPEGLWPYDDETDVVGGRRPAYARPPATAALVNAMDRRAPTSYRRITTEGRSRIDDVKRALGAGHLVCFGTNVSSRFVADELGDVVVDPPSASDAIAGGHAMALAGHVGDVFDVVNSWGAGWGDHGWARLSADYVAWDRSRDFWIVESAPAF
jgi:C1A family cysteine protease